MRIAWFRATTPDTSDPLDDTARLIDELRRTFSVDVIVEAAAHDFVWQQLLTPWDLCVYELGNTAAHQFEWGYLLNYPGVVMLRSLELQNSSGASLSREGRLSEYMTGFRFDDHQTAPPLLRVPLMASKTVVVAHPALARSLQEDYPAAQIRYAPDYIAPGGPVFPGESIGEDHPSGPRKGGMPQSDGHPSRPITFGLLDQSRLDVVERALQRARDMGAVVDLLTEGSAAQILSTCDVVVALTWPPYEMPLTAALAGMAAGKPVVTLELEATADWPALDPQTWKPRGVAATLAPIAVTLDPRDEEHSLMLTMRRLATDQMLRDELGRAAMIWWQTLGTPAQAVTAWSQILEEAVALTPPPRPPDWPQHLGADGTELARAILNEFGLKSDL